LLKSKKRIQRTSPILSLLVLQDEDNGYPFRRLSLSRSTSNNQLQTSLSRVKRLRLKDEGTTRTSSYSQTDVNFFPAWIAAMFVYSIRICMKYPIIKSILSIDHQNRLCRSFYNCLHISPRILARLRSLIAYFVSPLTQPNTITQ
jgi:hypothetical protein